MPSLKNHLENLKYEQLHKWLDGNIPVLKKITRHIPTKKRIEFINKKFGKKAVEEYLEHIKQDYYNNLISRLLINTVGRIEKWKTNRT